MIAWNFGFFFFTAGAYIGFTFDKLRKIGLFVVYRETMEGGGEDFFLCGKIALLVVFAETRNEGPTVWPDIPFLYVIWKTGHVVKNVVLSCILTGHKESQLHSAGTRNHCASSSWKVKLSSGNLSWTNECCKRSPLARCFCTDFWVVMCCDWFQSVKRSAGQLHGITLSYVLIWKRITDIRWKKTVKIDKARCQVLLVIYMLKRK